MSNDATTIHIDGAARGNPGPAAFAFVIARPDGPPIEQAGLLGTATNNFAEYTALVRALTHARDLGLCRLEIRSDSELLVKQMNGIYRVKNKELQELYEQAQGLVSGFERVHLEHVRRAQNADADRLCNEALDGKRGEGAAPRSPAPRKRPAAAAPSGSVETAQADAIACLQAAAAQWARGKANDPPPEAVWDQLWSILEENGVVRGQPAR